MDQPLMDQAGSCAEHVITGQLTGPWMRPLLVDLPSPLVLENRITSSHYCREHAHDYYVGNGNSITSLDWWLRLGEKTIYRISEPDDVTPMMSSQHSPSRVAWLPVYSCRCMAPPDRLDLRPARWPIVTSLNSQSPLRSYASWVDEKSTIDACSVLDWLSPLGCCSPRVIDDGLDGPMPLYKGFGCVPE
jgi:hypothetical protein